jgi:hypothetical protein
LRVFRKVVYSQSLQTFIKSSPRVHLYLELPIMIESANALELRRIHLSPLRIGSLPFRAMPEVCPVNRAACLFAAQSHGMTIAALLYQYPARASTDGHMVW